MIYWSILSRIGVDSFLACRRRSRSVSYQMQAHACVRQKLGQAAENEAKQKKREGASARNKCEKSVTKCTYRLHILCSSSSSAHPNPTYAPIVQLSKAVCALNTQFHPTHMCDSFFSLAHFHLLLTHDRGALHWKWDTLSHRRALLSSVAVLFRFCSRARSFIWANRECCRETVNIQLSTQPVRLFVCSRQVEFKINKAAAAATLLSRDKII
jgi:hypothetical protein